ncbi:MAG: hypothetical protein OXU68_08625 [Bacteroidota bacterium]|nr:hypothetical protein [Bacteroidota bacterium]
MRYIAPALLLLIVVGCSTTQSIPIEDRSRTYDVSYDVAFDAVVLALAEQGYAVEEANKEQGGINTDFLLQESFLSWLSSSASRMKVTSLVRDTEAGVRVMLTIALQDSDPEATGPNYSSRNLRASQARRVYDSLFAHIEAVMWSDN